MLGTCVPFRKNFMNMYSRKTYRKPTKLTETEETWLKSWLIDKSLHSTGFWVFWFWVFENRKTLENPKLDLHFADVGYGVLCSQSHEYFLDEIQFDEGLSKVYLNHDSRLFFTYSSRVPLYLWYGRWWLGKKAFAQVAQIYGLQCSLPWFRNSLELVHWTRTFDWSLNHYYKIRKLFNGRWVAMQAFMTSFLRCSGVRRAPE